MNKISVIMIAYEYFESCGIGVRDSKGSAGTHTVPRAGIDL